MLSRLLLPGVVLLLAGTLLMGQCGMLFRCGCEAPWGAGSTHCNVRRAGEPHCPWCEWPSSLGAVGGGVALVLPPALVAALRRRGVGAGAALAAGVVAIPLAAAAGAGATWLATDYPHLLVEGIRDRAGVPNGPLHCGP